MRAFAALAALTACAAAPLEPSHRRTLIVEHAYDAQIARELRGLARNTTVDIIDATVTSPGRRTDLVSRLRAHAAAQQSRTLELLDGRADEHDGRTAFWICNCIAVHSPSATLEAELRALKNTLRVREQRFAQLDPLEEEQQQGEAADRPRRHRDELEWNVEIVAANKVWEQSAIRGEGVVVASIDTGVRHTHEAMREHYRPGDHSWLDAEGEDRWPNGPSETSFDNQGHGTHVAGSMSGSMGIGVAPGADWINCKAFDSSGRGAEVHILACAEFIGCPTRWDGTDPRCELAPHVVSNSWGFACGGCTGLGDPMQRMTEVWRALGIYAVFAAGNSGPACGTATSPADLDNVLSVGGTDFHDSVAQWSSKGPPVDPLFPYGRQKPEMSAPGQGVRSAGRQTDTSYSQMSGTSMAAPHAAGAAALLLSVKRSLLPEEITRFLLDAADVGTLAPDRTCGGIPDTEFPNYSYGTGRLNACRPLQHAAPELGLDDCESPGPPGQDDCYCTDTCEAGCNRIGMSCCCGAFGGCFCSENPGCCPMNAGMPCEEWRGGGGNRSSAVPAWMPGMPVAVSSWDK